MFYFFCLNCPYKIDENEMARDITFLHASILSPQALADDMQMRLSALESVKNAAEDLIKQATDSQDEAVQGLSFPFPWMESKFKAKQWRPG